MSFLQEKEKGPEPEPQPEASAMGLGDVAPSLEELEAAVQETASEAEEEEGLCVFAEVQTPEDGIRHLRELMAKGPRLSASQVCVGVLQAERRRVAEVRRRTRESTERLRRKCKRVEELRGALRQQVAGVSAECRLVYEERYLIKEELKYLALIQRELQQRKTSTAPAAHPYSEDATDVQDSPVKEEDEQKVSLDQFPSTCVTMDPGEDPLAMDSKEKLKLQRRLLEEAGILKQEPPNGEEQNLDAAQDPAPK